MKLRYPDLIEGPDGWLVIGEEPALHREDGPQEYVVYPNGSTWSDWWLGDELVYRQEDWK